VPPRGFCSGAKAIEPRTGASGPAGPAARLKAAATDDIAAYRAAPPDTAEFGSDDEPLSWEGEGWEEFSAKG